MKRKAYVVDAHKFAYDLVDVAVNAVFPNMYEVQYFASGNEFGSYLATEFGVLGDSDLLFLEMRMDSGDGISVLENIASLGLANFPVLIMSSLEEELVEYITNLIGDFRVNIVIFISKNIPGCLYRELVKNKKNIELGCVNNRYDINETESELSKKLKNISESGSVKLTEYMNDCFVPYIQPKININKNALVGFEFLSRFIDPTYGVVFPSIFLNTLDTNEKICLFNEVVIDRFIRIISQFHNDGYLFTFSINIDPIALTSEPFSIKLDEILAKYSLIHRLVTFEITEDSDIKSNKCHRLISALKLKGFRVSIDDFGKGFSNIDRIKELPYDEVKIDRKLIRDVASSEIERRLVFALIKYFKNLGKSIVAEGVEEVKTIETLRNLGCDEVQGYYYYYPKPHYEINDIIYKFFLSNIYKFIVKLDPYILSEKYSDLFSTTIEDLELLKLNSNDSDKARKLIHRIKDALVIAGFNDCTVLIDNLNNSGSSDYFTFNFDILMHRVLIYQKILKERNFIVEL